jgi:hypothetical protein
MEEKTVYFADGRPTVYQTAGNLYESKAPSTYGDLYDLSDHLTPQSSEIYTLGNNLSTETDANRGNREKPVLEDLPVKRNLEVVELAGEEFESLWSETEHLLKDLQNCFKRKFGGLVVKIDEMQSVLEKLIVKTMSKEVGSPLISKFCFASRNNDSSLSSEVFSSFESQAERFAKVVISEVHEHSTTRLIPDAHIGGVAGGSKYIAG